MEINFLKIFYSKIFYLAFFILVLFLNLFSWLIIGRSNTLILAAENFYTQYYVCIDSINVPMNIETEWNERYYHHFSENRRRAFKKILSTKTIKVNIIQTVSSNMIFNVDNIYMFYIVDWFPLYCHLKSDSLIKGAGLSYDCYFIWFFGWHRILGPFGPPYW